MIRWFVVHPTAANLLMIVFFIIGVASVPQLRRETFPDFVADKVEIRVVYPGARAEDVELAICQRLEDALDSILFVSEMTCEARQGLGIAVAELTEGGDINTFVSDIQTEVEAIDSFPDIVETPTVRRLNLTERVISLVITAPMTVVDLQRYAEQIKDKLTALPTISQVEIQGFSDYQVRIEPRAAILRHYGLSVASLAAAIGTQSLDLPSGTIQTDERNILVRFSDERRRAVDFENLVIAAGDRGGEVRLSEVARITEMFEYEEDKILFNGQRAAVLRISKTKREDILIVVDSIRSFLQEEQRRAAPSVHFTLIEDQARNVRDRLNLLLKNGAQGLVLVFAVMCLFFSIRFSFWVAMGLPVSFLGALWLMSVLGMSINMLTMVGLLIAIGLLMDDAIVIAESIAVARNRGLSVVEAAVQGVTKVAPGVLSSFLTSICVFTPLAFIEGDIGKVLKVIPVVLISVLSISLIEAFLILPHHITQTLSHSSMSRVSRFRSWIDAGFLGVRDGLIRRLIGGAISWRYLSIGLVVMLFFMSLALLGGGQVKSRGFPSIEGDIVQARVLLSAGSTLAQTEAVVQRIVAALETVRQEFAVRHAPGQDVIKTTTVQFNLNTDAYERGPHLATVTVELLSTEERRVTIDEFTDLWRRTVGEVADIQSLTYKEPVFGPAGADIEIRLQGNDLTRLDAAAAALRLFLTQFQGVRDLEDDLRLGQPELHLTLLEGAYDMGFTATTVAHQLRSAFYGTTVDEVQIGSHNVEIDVRLAAVDRNSLADLDYFTLIRPTESGTISVPLSEVAHIEEDRGYARLNRIDAQRTVTVRGTVQGVNANEILSIVENEFNNSDFAARFPGVSFSFAGAKQEQEITQNSMQRGFLLGLLGVFLLLSFQFRSYLEPLLIMLSIPMALIGVLWGHLLMGLEFSMPSLLGFVSLSGIVVNNGILLLQAAKQLIQSGTEVTTALIQASCERFRAIVLTTATTVAGLLPILLETSLQAQIIIPLVTSLAFGLVASVGLILVVLPAFYQIIHDLGLIAQHDP